MTIIITTLQAQKASKTAKSTTGYAITAIEKGGRSWKEVRQIDVASGEDIKTIYDSKQEAEPLNARTGKAVEKTDVSKSKTTTTTFTSTYSQRKVVNLDQVLDKANNNHNNSYARVIVVRHNTLTYQPFSTNSAALAYDNKHERLYYTPMNINQLRYIDLKSGKIYFFEDEELVTGRQMHDVSKQITRMVIASDGNGYALTNDGNNLIRFTTGKKPTITDLGSLTDDVANKKYSIHSRGGYGGDIIADASENLYLITANRNVFKINIESKVATHLGTIKGLPAGFSTNGAMVEEGSKVIIASSESTIGYYRFDLNTLEAEKISSGSNVYNASDLANGNLAFDKKKKQKNEEATPVKQTEVTDAIAKKGQQEELSLKNGISVYPNPVTDGMVRLSFSEQPAGKYRVQLLDMSGRLITTKEVNINSVAQIEEFRFPELSVKGNYLLRITNELNKVNVTNKIVVQ